MILVDTSVWIGYFKATPSAQAALLEDCLGGKEVVCIWGVILTEVLQGIKYQRDYKRVLKLFESLIFLPMEHAIFLRAAEIYRSLRQQGLTIRKPIDCMIAAVALEYDIPLLHQDRDFEPIEKVFQLKTPPLPD